MTKLEPSLSRPGRLLGWICAGHCLSHFWLLTLPPLFPALADHFDVTYFQLGLLVTLYSLSNGIFQVSSGYLVDRYGAKPILVAGLLLNGFTFALYGLAPAYAVLLCLALVAGIGQSVFHPADYAVLSSAFARERAGKPYSIHTFSGFAGSAVAPITVAALYQAFGWKVTLAISGFAGIALAIFIGLRLQFPAGVSTRTDDTPDGKVRRHSSLFLSQALILMLFFYVFATMAGSGIQTFLPSSLTELYEIPLSTANAALTAYLSTLAIGVLLGGVVADRVSNHARVVGTMFAGGMLVMFLLAVTRPPVWVLFPIFALAGAFHGVIMPSRDKMVREAAPEGAAGKSFGFVSTGLSLGSMIAPLILGSLLDMGRPGYVFWAITGFMLLAVLTTLAPRRGRALAHDGDQ